MIKNILYQTLNYIAAVVMTVAFFTHFFLPHPEPEVVSASKLKSETASQIENYKDSIIDYSIQFRNRTISETSYFEILDKYENQIGRATKLLSVQEADYQEVRKKHTVFGYPSRHKFMWSLGLGIIISIGAVRIISYSHSLKGYERAANVILGVIQGTVGGYMFAWVFYPDNDLPYGYYMAILVTIGFLASLLTYFATSFYKSNRQKAELLETMLDISTKINTKE